MGNIKIIILVLVCSVNIHGRSMLFRRMVDIYQSSNGEYIINPWGKPYYNVTKGEYSESYFKPALVIAKDVSLPNEIYYGYYNKIFSSKEIAQMVMKEKNIFEKVEDMNYSESLLFIVTLKHSLYTTTFDKKKLEVNINKTNAYVKSIVFSLESLFGAFLSLLFSVIIIQRYINKKIDEISYTRIIFLIISFTLFLIQEYFTKGDLNKLFTPNLVLAPLLISVVLFIHSFTLKKSKVN